MRDALGRAVFRAPERVRATFPRALREAVRRRIGPFAPWEAGYRPIPPPVGPDERVGAPDFVGIGVQKAGTTWWYGLIADHPAVHHPVGAHKERHYFAPFATRRFDDGAVEDYHRLFPRPPGSQSGEWTPDYIHQPWVLPLLRRAAPDAKLLVLLRDPVERMLSGLAHEERRGDANLGAVSADALSRSRYAEGVARALSLFGDRVLVLQYEACVADPRAELARTYEFLGVDPGHEPAALAQPVSPTAAEDKVVLDDEARQRLVELLRADVDATTALVPGLDVGLWPNFRTGAVTSP